MKVKCLDNHNVENLLTIGKEYQAERDGDMFFLVHDEERRSSFRGSRFTVVSTNRGFASLDPVLQKNIASQGGKAVQASGNAHKFFSEEAREAGRKGGLKTSQDRERMRAIGRAGGIARARKAKERKEKEEQERRTAILSSNRS